MPEVHDNKNEIILNYSQKRTLNDIFKIWREKFNKVSQSRSKQKQSNVDREIKIDDTNKDVLSQIPLSKVIDYSNCKMSENRSISFFSRNPLTISRCSNLELSILRPIFRRKNEQFNNKDELKDICRFQVNLASSKSFIDNIEFARKLSDERINRAKNYYKKLQNHVKPHALDEAVEYVFNEFNEIDLAILLKYNFDTKCSNITESELPEIYSRANSKISDSRMFHSRSTTKIFSENDYSFIGDSLMLQTINSSNGISELSLTDSDTAIDNSLLLLESDYLNINIVSDYLVSRISNVPIKINKTVSSCIKRKIIHTKT
ncbi:hypothetical protein FG386_000745 [Cryptosporidium ryanae]|uniref:uncharacterized protein n=1 Tax=Cryptosporidium ryanae TaxID=515981 RepID=UPI00351A21B4|nr:hypothetical protein FG386_000745 [Cryptosporidium ryanae]